MSTELDTLSAGDIASYDPGMPVLAPLSPSPDTWGNTDVDLLREDHQRAPSGPTLFGAALPAGTSPQQLQAVLGQLSGAFLHDLSSLGYPSHMVNAAIQFVAANATKAPYQVTRQHGFNLHGADDWLSDAFGNMVHQLSGSPRAKQSFVTASLKWLAKANHQLNAQQQVTVSQAQGSVPHSTEAILNRLSDSDYAKVIAINDKAQAQTMNILAAKHGEYSVRQVVEIAQAQLNSLPAIERAHFDQFTSGWVHMMNCVETLEFLYNAAIGSASLPRDGAGIAQEIKQIEELMRTPATRRAYLNDPQLQARYRTLLDLKG